MTESLDNTKEGVFDLAVRDAIVKPQGHVQYPLPKGFEGQRYYSVTTIARNASFGGTRTVVICDSFEAAKEIVEKNRGDIFETSYMLAVIEAIAINRLYFYFTTENGSEQYWYRWAGDYMRGKYEPIEVPKPYAMIVGWGVG